MKSLSKGAHYCINKFLRIFPNGFQDEGYYELERGYKWKAHKHWESLLNRKEFQILLKEKKFGEIASRALKVESRTHLLFSFEKMAIRDAVKTDHGARIFAESLFALIHGKGSDKAKFVKWSEAVSQLPRRQTRVLTWPILTVFGFLAQPKKFIYFKPTVTRVAAEKYGFELFYKAPISIEAYDSFYKFVNLLKKNLKNFHPKDLIDIQSFIWVQGSSEYE